MRVRYVQTAEIDIPDGTVVTLTNGLTGTVAGAVGPDAPGWFYFNYVDEDPEVGAQHGQYELLTLPASYFPGESEYAQSQRVGLLPDPPPETP